MDHDEIRELTAAYALDALDPDERAEFEEHLAGCESCREEVAVLSSAAAALAIAAPPVDPPPALRERILDAARAERPNVVPLRPRWASPIGAVAAVAAIAACAAIGLGAWNLSLHHQLDQARSAQSLKRVPVSGASGSLVVAGNEQAALVLSDLRAAPEGKTYQAWVISGKQASSAGIFRGGSGTTYVRLAHPVGEGDVVAVTVEPAGGSDQPTTKPFIVSTRVV
jgi:anti-sigma-K factor RskA